jgi:hypothetical protein
MANTTLKNANRISFWETDLGIAISVVGGTFICCLALAVVVILL